MSRKEIAAIIRSQTLCFRSLFPKGFQYTRARFHRKMFGCLLLWINCGNGSVTVCSLDVLGDLCCKKLWIIRCCGYVDLKGPQTSFQSLRCLLKGMLMNKWKHIAAFWHTNVLEKYSAQQDSLYKHSESCLAVTTLVVNVKKRENR